MKNEKYLLRKIMVQEGRTRVRGELVLISFAILLCGAGGCGCVHVHMLLCVMHALLCMRVVCMTC
jgi:hypothetical protein